MKKIAFIKTNNFSHAFVSLHKGLQKNFPDHEIVVIDLWKDVIFRYHFMSLLSCMLTYGPELISKQKKISTALLRTEYFYKTVRKRLLELMSGERYAFTFQLQSIFDASIPGVPHFIYTDHTHLANTYFPAFGENDLFSDKWIALEKEIYARADVVFAMSSHVKKSLVEHYAHKEQKLEVVGCGFNVTPIEDALFNHEKYASKTILFIGKDWKRKGGPLLVKAFGLVLKQIPDAKLRIVGCSPKIDIDNCSVHGLIPLEEAKHFYNTAAVFCMPTRREPFGYVFLEAFASKLPVVATKIGALPDIVKDGESGFLVSEHAQELANKLMHLLENPHIARQFGQTGYDSIINKYTWPNTVRKICDTIKTLI